ncbi:MAG: site-specific DNA-methyltransferase [Acidobacteria bacterium]|nr:MAG: site-specific DNA-methyltransferase [Acidobacteriota bacterium]
MESQSAKSAIENPKSEIQNLKSLPAPAFHDPKHQIDIYQGDCLELLPLRPQNSVDMIFADPPYFLSNNGITCHAGRMVSVNKGAWDRSRGPDANHEFNRAWLAACQRVLKPNGTIWVSGTAHVIHSVGFAMQQLGMKLLNDITWIKPNPPPNLSCRYFTHATETLIWAAKNLKSRHTFNYRLMKELAGGRQMKSVWQIDPPERAEKRFGKHPTQKPVALLERILLASSKEGDLVLDPFMGSGTTAVAAVRLRRAALAVEAAEDFSCLASGRLLAEFVWVGAGVDYFEMGLDLYCLFMDRSNGMPTKSPLHLPSKLVHRERKFYFVGLYRREIIFTVTALSMEEAWHQFQSSGASKDEVFSVIKTETEIYLAQ